MSPVFINSWWTDPRKDEGYRVVYIVHEASEKALKVLLAKTNDLIIQFNTQVKTVARAFATKQTSEFIHYACTVLRGLHYEIRDSICQIKCSVPIVSNAVTNLLEQLWKAVEAVHKEELLQARGLWTQPGVASISNMEIPQIVIYEPSKSATRRLREEKTWAFVHVKHDMQSWIIGKHRIFGTNPPHYINEDHQFRPEGHQGMPWEDERVSDNILQQLTINPVPAAMHSSSGRKVTSRPATPGVPSHFQDWEKMTEGAKLRRLCETYDEPRIHNPIGTRDSEAEILPINPTIPLLQMSEGHEEDAFKKPWPKIPRKQSTPRSLRPPPSPPNICTYRGMTSREPLLTTEGEKIGFNLDERAWPDEAAPKSPVFAFQPLLQLNQQQEPYNITKVWPGPYPLCVFCRGSGHWAMFCNEALQMTYQERSDKLYNYPGQICPVCFQQGHQWYHCQSHHVCVICASTMHSRLLHFPYVACKLNKHHLKKLVHARMRNYKYLKQKELFDQKMFQKGNPDTIE
jgi:hypothetical protein